MAGPTAAAGSARKRGPKTHRAVAGRLPVLLLVFLWDQGGRGEVQGARRGAGRPGAHRVRKEVTRRATTGVRRRREAEPGAPGRTQTRTPPRIWRASPPASAWTRCAATTPSGGSPCGGAGQRRPQPVGGPGRGGKFQGAVRARGIGCELQSKTRGAIGQEVERRAGGPRGIGGVVTSCAGLMVGEEGARVRRLIGTCRNEAVSAVARLDRDGIFECHVCNSQCSPGRPSRGADAWPAQCSPLARWTWAYGGARSGGRCRGSSQRHFLRCQTTSGPRTARSSRA